MKLPHVIQDGTCVFCAKPEDQVNPSGCTPSWRHTHNFQQIAPRNYKCFYCDLEANDYNSGADLNIKKDQPCIVLVLGAIPGVKVLS